MNPFLNPEFWLSLAFILVVGMIIFSPVRKSFQKFFGTKRQQILDQINQAHETLSEAQDLLKEEQKKGLDQSDLKEQHQQIKALQQEFLQKTNVQIQIKKQDYQTRLKLTEVQIKNQLRAELLDKVERKILKATSTKSMDKEIQHFLQMLDKKEFV